MLTAVIHLYFVLISYGWCCKEEGRLLKLYVDVIKKEQVRAVVQSEKEASDECCYSSIAVIMFAGIPFPCRIYLKHSTSVIAACMVFL